MKKAGIVALRLTVMPGVSEALTVAVRASPPTRTPHRAPARPAAHPRAAHASRASPPTRGLSREP